MRNKHYNRLAIIKVSILAASTIILAVSYNAYANNQTNIRLENFWISQAPNVARSTAGYGTIKNIGSEPDTLISIRSNAASMVMLHETKINSGMGGMEHVSSFVIKPGTELILKPMSFHLMLMKLTSNFTRGEKVKLWFKFINAGEIETDAPILSAEEGKEYLP